MAMILPWRQVNLKQQSFSLLPDLYLSESHLLLLLVTYTEYVSETNDYANYSPVFVNKTSEICFKRCAYVTSLLQVFYFYF